RVVFYDSYRLEDGINLLKQAHIAVIQIDMEA
ncbi:MAG TPA: CMP deaminase, partial [Prolixibacteraceae bacterium]|nr:CMP deaminase [Prolixibacteraceae bacterium]